MTKLNAEIDTALGFLWPNSKKHQLTGANILNVIQYVCLKTAQNGKQTASLGDVTNGISREFRKEGKLS